MKQKILVFLVFFFSLTVYGQDATKVTEILDSLLLTKGQAAYIAASWLNTDNESLDFQQATQLIVSEGFLTEDSNAADPIRLDELSNLCMKTWNIPGGLFYRMTKANRYAFKELKALGYLSTTDDPSFSVTGSQGMNIMFKCMEYNTPSLPTE